MKHEESEVKIRQQTKAITDDLYEKLYENADENMQQIMKADPVFLKYFQSKEHDSADTAKKADYRQQMGFLAAAQ